MLSTAMAANWLWEGREVLVSALGRIVDSSWTSVGQVRQHSGYCWP